MLIYLRYVPCIHHQFIGAGCEQMQQQKDAEMKKLRSKLNKLVQGISGLDTSNEKGRFMLKQLVASAMK